MAALDTLLNVALLQSESSAVLVRRPQFAPASHSRRLLVVAGESVLEASSSCRDSYGCRNDPHGKSLGLVDGKKSPGGS